VSEGREHITEQQLWYEPVHYMPLPEVAIDGVVVHPRPFEYTSYTITLLSNGQHDATIVFHPGEQRFKLVGSGQMYEDNTSPHDRHDQMVLRVEPFEEDRLACDGWAQFPDGRRVTCTLKEGHSKRDSTSHVGTLATDPMEVLHWG
jgi:hypothetical protein